MSVILYNIFLLLFRAGTHIAAVFNPKAKKWVKGRKNILQKIEAAIPTGEKIIWVHCASLGEFEQGRPVLERLKEQGTRHKVLLTFFSPSGYEVQKNYAGADWVFYLPLDGPRTAKRFLEIVQPSLVIFVKYEFWYYYLKKIKYRSIPLILISALFRKDMSFFQWYGGLQQKILSRFDHLFVQNESSKKLMDDIGLGGITSVSGDTRFDRVVEIAGKFQPLPLVERFIGTKKIIVAGSTWKEDEVLLKNAMPYFLSNDLKLLIAPHEISEKSIDYLQGLFPGSILYSQLEKDPGFADAPCLIIDNIGMLSRLYNYAYCCYIGGGFTRSGIHNVLEAAVYDKPVFFGPNYEKYHEAVELVATGAGISVAEKEALIAALNRFINEEALYRETCANAGNYVRGQAGATQRIMDYIQEKRLLTS